MVKKLLSVIVLVFLILSFYTVSFGETYHDTKSQVFSWRFLSGDDYTGTVIWLASQCTSTLFQDFTSGDDWIHFTEASNFGYSIKWSGIFDQSVDVYSDRFIDYYWNDILEASMYAPFDGNVLVSPDWWWDNTTRDENYPATYFDSMGIYKIKSTTGFVAWDALYPGRTISNEIKIYVFD